MAENNDIPPIPVPPQAGGIPPVEPPPAAPAPPAAPVVPGAPEPLPPVAPPAPEPPRPDPYAQPGAYAAAPPTYAQPGAVPPGYAYQPVAAGPAQGLSLASMIVGIASVLLAFASLGFLPSIAAVVLGHLGQKRQPYARPLWLTGLITGYIALGISLIWGLFLVISIIIGITSSSYRY